MTFGNSSGAPNLRKDPGAAAEALQAELAAIQDQEAAERPPTVLHPVNVGGWVETDLSVVGTAGSYMDRGLPGLAWTVPEGGAWLRQITCNLEDATSIGAGETYTLEVWVRRPSAGADENTGLTLTITAGNDNARSALAHFYVEASTRVKILQKRGAAGALGSSDNAIADLIVLLPAVTPPL